jgi:hypothetical protein
MPRGGKVMGIFGMSKNERREVIEQFEQTVALLKRAQVRDQHSVVEGIQSGCLTFEELFSSASDFNQHPKRVRVDFLNGLRELQEELNQAGGRYEAIGVGLYAEWVTAWIRGYDDIIMSIGAEIGWILENWRQDDSATD